MPVDVLIFYNYYYPAYKAGGPVQSLVNLTGMLSAMDKKTAVITGSYELNESEPLTGVAHGEWNKYNGYQVYYLDSNNQGYSKIKSLLMEQNPSCIYINGLYSIPFTVFPLLVRKRNLRSTKMVWAPRGMLQKGALAVKPFKKQLFLRALKIGRLYSNVVWHATDEQESEDIKTHFGASAHVIVAPNIPKQPLQQVAEVTKEKNELRLIYLSLITEKKNLHLALQILAELNLPVTFHIYGPVKDQQYWERCKVLIDEMPPHIRVQYKGDVKPAWVQKVFAEYHALLLPSKGENFGHAIYECLSVGRPVVISSETPWKNLDKKKAGFDIAISDRESFGTAIKTLYEMGEGEYAGWCQNALSTASEYWNQNDFRSAYASLFTN